RKDNGEKREEGHSRQEVRGVQADRARVCCMSEDRDELTEKVIGAAIEVHRELGPGLLESVYQSCFELELSMQGIEFFARAAAPVFYKGTRAQSDLVMDVF